jgi:D-sedoheptulose 7-phosphate isomerase
MNPIEQRISESIQVKQDLFTQTDLIQVMVDRIIAAFQNGNKLLICGNGGSAADAQHIAAEFVGKFLHERQALPAIALTTNTSTITALGNDYHYDVVFARQIEALANAGDILVAISTSGNSMNVVKASLAARARGCVTMGFTGQTGGRLQEYADLCLCVSSLSTPRIQEAHITIWHIICELVELAFVDDRNISVSCPTRSLWRN